MSIDLFFVFLFNNLCSRRHSCLSETSQLWIPARHVCLLPCPLCKGWMGHKSSLQGGHVSSSRPTQKLKRWIWVWACTRTIGHTNQKEDLLRNAKAYVSSHHPPKNHYNIPICNVARMLGRKEGRKETINKEPFIYFYFARVIIYSTGNRGVGDKLRGYWSWFMSTQGHFRYLNKQKKNII